MTYLFDFGDHWEFQVTLEQLDVDKKPPAKAALLQERGQAPAQYPNWESDEE